MRIWPNAGLTRRLHDCPHQIPPRGGSQTDNRVSRHLGSDPPGVGYGHHPIKGGFRGEKVEGANTPGNNRQHLPTIYLRRVVATKPFFILPTASLKAA
jgi:hypothetical protein